MTPIHVVGAGGIGCAVGYELRVAGVPVVFVEANAAKVRAGQRDGVRVDDRPPLAAEFVPFHEWQPPTDATVLLCVKCYDNAEVLRRLPADVELIPIQNGFDTELLEHGHDFEGIASFVSECDANRPHTRITRPGELHIGRSHPSPTPPRNGEGLSPPSLSGKGVGGLGSSRRSEHLFRVVEVPDISPIKHTKLMYNAAISPLAAAAGFDNGKLLSLPVARQLFFTLLQENYRILSAAGIALGKVGPFHPRTVAWILRRKWLAGLMAKRFEPSLRGTYCSMAGEIQKCRTEVDNYNGHLIRLAERTGTPCPLNRAVYELVTSMTAERMEPNVAMLDSLVGQASSLSSALTGWKPVLREVSK